MPLTPEDLQQIGDLMNQKLAPIVEHIDNGFDNLGNEFERLLVKFEEVNDKYDSLYKIVKEQLR